MINKLRRGGTSLPKVTPSFASLKAEADKRLFFSVCMYVSMYVCMYVCMLFHPGHQRSQFTPLNGTGVTLCSFCSYLHEPDPCILGGCPLSVEWAFFGATIALQDSL